MQPCLSSYNGAGELQQGSLTLTLTNPISNRSRLITLDSVVQSLKANLWFYGPRASLGSRREAECTLAGRCEPAHGLSPI
jgi:hypothetical protein